MIDLPEAPFGMRVWRFQVGVDGRLSAMLSTSARAAPLAHDATNAVAVLEHGHWRVVASFSPLATYYCWDVAPDDWCVVAETRARLGDKNAISFADGKEVERFHLGDAIEHIQCDTEHGFWVGYFDESNLPYGLARFRRNGEQDFAYPSYMVDCYALNVARDDVSCCYYTDFPIVSLSLSGVATEWSNPAVTGAKHILVHGKHAVLIGGYAEEKDRVALLILRNHQARFMGATKLSDHFPGISEHDQIITRGDRIYVVSQNSYRVLSTTELGLW